MDLEGKTVIITGAGSGIGRVLARTFARHGAHVVCCGRRPQPLEQTALLVESDGGKATVAPLDVTEPADVNRMVSSVLRQFGVIHVLFNNAGVLRSIGGVYEIDAARWWNEVKVNLFGPLLLMRAVLPHMMSRNEGIIINMDGGRSRGMSAYGCSKAALMELTRAASEELKAVGSSVVILAAYPDFVRTPMAESLAACPAGPKWMPWLKEALDTGRARPAQEIADATIQMVQTVTPAQSGTWYGPAGLAPPPWRKGQ